MNKITVLGFIVGSFLAAPANADFNQTLQWHESKGGHTIALHTGKTLTYLLNRCSTGGVSEASTWSSVSGGQALVNSLLAKKASEIAAWKASATTQNLILRDWGKDNSPNGTYVRCPSTVSNGPRGRTAVLKKTTLSPSGWIVLTSYPYATSAGY
ncbi:RNase A-like domain-containing protein [Paracoccus sanguinis]|uniref:RNase A-like domain-containing protein n=1 Tax=Paracoccus sanguinis TaxID=1545044 RepID=UPI00155B2FC3